MLFDFPEEGQSPSNVIPVLLETNETRRIPIKMNIDTDNQKAVKPKT